MALNNLLPDEAKAFTACFHDGQTAGLSWATPLSKAARSMSRMFSPSRLRSRPAKTYSHSPDTGHFSACRSCEKASPLA